MKAREEGSADAAAVEDGYRGDLTGGEAAGGSKAATAAPGELARAPTRKGGSGDARVGKMGKVQNGKVATLAVASMRGKKPEMSQSASFLARGPTSAKKGGTVAATPKQAKLEGKGAVPNGSEAAAGRAVEKKARTTIARRSLLKHRP